MFFSRKLSDRYRELKKESGNCILLMQVGAFMHAMGDDAAAVSKVTGLKLQLAGDVEDPVKIGGFPRSGLDAYVGRLVRAGHSVSLAFQDENKERRIGETIRIRE